MHYPPDSGMEYSSLIIFFTFLGNKIKKNRRGKKNAISEIEISPDQYAAHQ